MTPCVVSSRRQSSCADLRRCQRSRCSWHAARVDEPTFVDVMVEPNPSSGDEELLLRFKSEEPARPIEAVWLDGRWCDVVGWDAGGGAAPAQALLVEDSGSGTALLICGAAWGIRVSPPDASPYGETHL